MIHRCRIPRPPPQPFAHLQAPNAVLYRAVLTEFVRAKGTV
jgi:hypothetical protein